MEGATGATGRISIIGAGRVGTAMAALLSGKGHEFALVADPRPEARKRAARLSGAGEAADPAEAAKAADLVLITTPDAAIRPTAELIAGSLDDLSGKKFVHMSGALSLEALAPLRVRGADILSIHPLQTFADLEGARKALPGSTFGVTCDPGLREWAASFVAGLDGRAHLIDDDDKALYHAAAAIASNLVAMVEYGALLAARRLGFGDGEFLRAFMPLAGATVENVSRLGPAAALTGPLARGDAETIEKHLLALGDLDPALVEMYRSACRVGLGLLAERGGMEPETLERLRAALEERGGRGRSPKDRQCE